MSHPPDWPQRVAPYLGHVLTILALALGGLSSFHALRAEVVELRANLASFLQLETEHTRAAESARVQLREDLRDVRFELRDLKQVLAKGVDRP